MSVISIVIGEKYYNKDPQSSELGRNIVSIGIELLDELGFEQFTFKKLAERINSTEASVYRYFDNKLKLLVYLTTWYWAWIEYLIDFKTYHISDPEEKLKVVLKIVCHVDESRGAINLDGLNLGALRRIVDTESDKTYLTKQVDEINSEGLFKGYKSLCHKIALIISEMNPKYVYPHALISTILEASHQQTFFAQHLPSLTEISVNDERSIENQVYDFLLQSVIKLVK
ncbi:MAG: TetR/AcrR family transcriptional regulator [Cyclobacteriaceae bacterium]